MKRPGHHASFEVHRHGSASSGSRRVTSPAPWAGGRGTRRSPFPAHGHDDEIADVEADLRDLDYDAPDFAAKQAALLAERARLKSLPMTPTVTDKRLTADTIGQYWQTLEGDEARRGYLMQQLGMKVQVRGRGVEPRALITVSAKAFVQANLTSGSWDEEDDDEMEYDDIIA